MARSLTLAVLVVGATLALAGCGGSAENDPVTFLVFGDPEEINAFRAVTDAYAERQPERTVELVEASDRSDLIARLSTSIAAGSPPDLFLINYRYFGQFAARDAIEPIDERLDRSTSFERDDFFPQPLDAFRWGGEQLCLPQNVSSLAVYANLDLFSRFDVPVPAGSWSWSQLITTATALTRDAEGGVVSGLEPTAGAARPAVFGLGVEPSIIRVAPIVWSGGGELVDDPGHPTRLALGTPRATEALRQFLSLRVPYGVTPTDEEVEAEDDETRFANGRLAMLVSSRRVVPTFRKITSFSWDVLPLPVLERAVNVLHSDAYCITRDADDKDAAWAFVEFALGPEGQRILARTGRTVPSLQSVARSDAFLDPSRPPAHARVFLDAVDHLRPLPTISTWPEIEDATEPILENAFYLGTPAATVAARLDEATRSIFARGETP